MNQNAPGRGSAELDSAILAWKSSSAQPEMLSDFARARLLARAAGPLQRTASLSSLFMPLRQLVLAGVLPLVVLTGLIGYVTHQGLVQSPSLQAPPISATKTHDGEVIFRIANGGRAHKVYLSTQPDRFEGAPAFVTRDGAFRDRLDGGPALVFYRID